jgi:DNA-binding CsgD family transcriptional regulator
MLTPHYEITLSDAEQHQLQALVRAGKTPQQLATRASIILLAQDGMSNQQIADTVGTSRNLVQKWRNRFALYVPPPLLPDEAADPVGRLVTLHDLPRSGRPPGFSPAGSPHRGRRGLSRA